MEVDSCGQAADINHETEEQAVENATDVTENSLSKSRDEFLDSLIESELDESTIRGDEVNNADQMLIEDNSIPVHDITNQSDNISDESHDTNALQKSISEVNETVADITDEPESEMLPDSINEDNKFSKPRDVLCHFPLGRIKRIVKADPEVTVINAESLFLISKATELFLRWLGKEVHAYTVQQKKKTIQLRDLNLAISENPALEFLDGALD